MHDLGAHDIQFFLTECPLLMILLIFAGPLAPSNLNNHQKLVTNAFREHKKGHNFCNLLIKRYGPQCHLDTKTLAQRLLFSILVYWHLGT